MVINNVTLVSNRLKDWIMIKEIQMLLLRPIYKHNQTSNRNQSAHFLKRLVEGHEINLCLCIPISYFNMNFERNFYRK